MGKERSDRQVTSVELSKITQPTILGGFLIARSMDSGTKVPNNKFVNFDGDGPWG